MPKMSEHTANWQLVPKAAQSLSARPVQVFRRKRVWPARIARILVVVGGAALGVALALRHGGGL